MQMVSAITWKKLSAEDQAVIREAAQRSAKIERELWAAKEKASEDKVKAGGSVVTELAAGEKQKFQDAMAPLYTKYGAGYEDVIARIQATK